MRRPETVRALRGANRVSEEGLEPSPSVED